MARAVVPVLQRTKGFIYDPTVTANILFQNAYLAYFNQSTMFAGNITSFGYMLQQGGDDIVDTIDVFKTHLTKYYSRYFDNIIVSVLESEDSSGSLATLSIYIEYDNQDHKETLAYAIKVIEGKADNIMKINNGE